MTRPPRTGTTASQVVATRFNTREYALIQERARSLDIDVSTLIRLAALDTTRVSPDIAGIMHSAETRALRLAEVVVLRGVCCVVDELIKQPRLRTRPMEDVTIVGYAEHQEYVTMPPSRRDAALIGQAIVRLCHTGKIVRHSTRPQLRATDLAVQLGLPDWAIGIRRADA